MTIIAGTADQILTVAEVAEYLKLSKSQLYTLIRRGEFPHVKIGEKTIRIRSSQLQAYLAQQAGPANEHRPVSV